MIYVFFSLGLLMMTVYYRFLHPRFNRARFSFAAPLKSELEDNDSERGTGNISGEKFELWI